ncbi:iron-hydroxamate ABC transporter substrate-binding protein [Ornithinibacillus bavariensis]|uniref:ABC transporter substrate-binding protein n=1 Tax=Ornithinibacillus bavariensis TaxID=545502 RepID=A0A919X933_9BACI|nr:iron-hydroxamate ABC transporter substrate-binding protein [Ornithinibacillus bavariensis]GIO28099.1 ABC transporter substrate-binding protein [Ornithinibacillus bavariensis]
MKKISIMVLILFIAILSGCGNTSTEGSKEEKAKEKTITYQSENGPVKVPADPQRVVVLSSFAGNVIALDVNIVGVDSWSKMNPRFQDKLQDVEEVSSDDLEKIIELEPDLIIGLSNITNIDKLKEIAPTVTFTYGKVDYLQQHIEIGKLLNREKEATAWVEDFKKRAADLGDKVRQTIGEATTVSVLESFDKQIYIYGDNWGRGTEILYQEMELEMPEKVKETALEPGYYAISQEVIPEYAGDYLVISKFSDQDNSYLESESFKNIPAVKTNQVIEVDAYEFYFNDPLTLDYQLETFEKAFLKN